MPQTIASLLQQAQATLFIQRDSVAIMDKKIARELNAKRLKERLADFSHGDRVEFVKRYKIPGGTAAMYQHVEALRPIGIDAAIAYAKAFGCGIEEISPEVAEKAVEVTSLISSAAHPANTSNAALIRQPETPYSGWPFEAVDESAYRELTPEGQRLVQEMTAAGITHAREKFGTARAKRKA